MDRILFDVVTVVICLSQRNPRLDPTPSQPDRKATGVMIPSIVFRSQRTLAIHRAAEFPRPDNERVIEHSSIRQVTHQRS